MKAKIKILFLILQIAVITSCKQYIDPPLVFEKDPGPDMSKDRKVLLISIDGLSGIELQKYVPINISNLLPQSKYSFSAYTDANTGDASTWTSILSGTKSQVHGISGDDFEEKIDEDDPHGNNGGASTGYVTIFQRLLETGKPLKSLAITSWDLLDKQLFSLADDKALVTSDLEAKNIAVDKIKNGDSNLSFATVNFRSVNDAGLAGGFSINNADYKSALDQVDGYVNDLLEALKQRKRFEKEDWLVIITSNHGGLGNSYGGGSMEERTVPVIYYQPHFVKQEFSPPPSVIGFKAKSGINGSMPASDATSYNIGTTGAYTIQLKLMVNQFGTLNPAIISKQNNTGNSDDGWSFIHNGGAGWRLKIKGTHVYAGNPTFQVGKWYTLTARIYMDGSSRKAQVFTDGALIADGVIGTAQGTSTANLNVGYSSSYAGGTLIQTVRDVRIYNTALPVEHIQSTYCQTVKFDDDLYKSNLIGSWDLGDGLGNELHNNVQAKPGFRISGAYSWEFMTNDFCKVITGEEEENSSLLYMYDVDMFSQVCYWLKIPTSASWKLAGSVFLDKYEKEFIGK